jgi:uncharacterized protein (UPF0248 family)
MNPTMGFISIDLFLYLDSTPNQLSEVIVTDVESNERLDFLEECLTGRKLNPSQEDFAKCLLKEAERIFEYGGDHTVSEVSLKETYATVCQYFLNGKCRFGEKCFNLHELKNTLSLDTPSGNFESKPFKQKTKIIESEKPRKKPPMKTATDVINRIQWDEKLEPKDFTVGYLDRFLGIVENLFTLFDWEDITSVDPAILAIPKHRIHYFKYRDEVVWDKNKRLDCVFGSTGSGMTIVDVIEKHRDAPNVES